MFLLILLCLLLTCTRCQRSMEELRYECGAHGKFEYCIDGVPGCVIGCHCHPGYYFDTDTKICESNTKLTQDFRRHYILPTRASSIVEYELRTPTSINVIDDKDTEYLGDWLYNQFFKTIESQVINKTNDNPKLTRRSGGDDVENLGQPAEPSKGGKELRGSRDSNAKKKDKRRTRKSGKGKSKRKKSKGHGLRRKLLRITEDDSLFESDSGVESSDVSSGLSSSMASSESTEDSRSDSLSEGDSSRQRDHEDREHGHKKVIIFNKRPRPPLPSFIFLPNMDSPYYPSIGLQPPPVMPMYPMVPVPPMGPMPPMVQIEPMPPQMPHPMPPPFVHYQRTESTSTSTPKLDIYSSTTNPDQTTTEATTTKTYPPETSFQTPSGDPDATEVPATETPETEIPDIEEQEPQDTEIPDIDGPSPDVALRSRIRNRRPKIPPLSLKSFDGPYPFGDPEFSLPSAPGQLERIKLLQKLRQRFQNQLPPRPADELEQPSLDEIQQLHKTMALHHKKPKHKKQKVNNLKSNKEVPFKYITELIHRSNLNYSKSRPMLQSLKKNQQLNARRSYGGSYSTIQPIERIKNKGSDDAYFTNLGRQIASLIRNVGPNTVPANPASVFNENTFTPRSYWERSVRSLSRLKNYFKKLLHYKNSNEDEEENLYGLENEVNSVISTRPPLTLQQLENILSIMHKTKKNIMLKKPTNQNNVRFKVNLLPAKPKLGVSFCRKHKNLTNNSNYNNVSMKNHKIKTKNYSNLMKYMNIVNEPKNNTNDPSKISLKDFKSLRLNWTELSQNSNQSRSPGYENNTNMSKESRIKYMKFLKRIPTIGLANLENNELPVNIPNESENSRIADKYSELPLDYISSLKSEFRKKYTKLNAKSTELPKTRRNDVMLHKNTTKLPEFRRNHNLQPAKSTMSPKLLRNYVKLFAKFAASSDLHRKFVTLSAKSTASPKSYDNFVKLPANSTALPDCSKNYVMLPTILPARSTASPALRRSSVMVPARTTVQPKLRENYISFSANSSASSDLRGNYVILPTKSAEPTKMHSNYIMQRAKSTASPDLRRHYDMLPPKTTASPGLRRNYAMLPAKSSVSSDSSINYVLLPAEPTAPPNLHRNDVILAEKFTGSSETRRNYVMLPFKTAPSPITYFDLPTDYEKIPAPFAELPTKYRVQRLKYPEQPKIFQSNHALASTDGQNYFTGGRNNHHYMFEAAYPVQVETYKKTYPNMNVDRVPSYFHHEFHHFDYF